MNSSSRIVVSRFIWLTIVRMCRTASTTFPEPASPLVRIMAAPSATRRSASPRLRAPHTNGTRKSCFHTWFSSSAGVNTSLSSMKSTSSACSTSASTKCPIRTLAITGIVTVAMISRITLIEAMRATPPSLRMSDGTRSKAITAQAPAFSAIFACSALVTSIMTPPLSISARPTFTRHSLALLFPLPFTFFASISHLLPEIVYDFLNCQAFLLRIPFTVPQDHESAPASRQHFSRRIADFACKKQVSSFALLLRRFHDDFVLHMDVLHIFHRQLCRHRPRLPKTADLAHGLIQQRRDDPAVRHSSAALIPRTQNEPPHDLAVRVVLLECQFHAAIVRPATAKTLVGQLRFEPDGVVQIAPSLSLGTYFSPWLLTSDQRHPATLGSSHAPLPLAHFYPEQIGERCYTAR